MSLQKVACFDYETFGDCGFDAIACTRSHDVRPYRTRTMVATVVTEVIRLPGVVVFRTQSESRASRTQKYYIPQNQLFDDDVTTGEDVKILISDKIHQGSGCCFARICETLKSTPMSPKHKVSSPTGSRKHSYCQDFSTYRSCAYGENCRLTHNHTEACHQRFYVAKIMGVSKIRGFGGLKVLADVKCVQAGITQTESRVYWVVHKLSNNVCKGHTVILQESSRKCGNRRYGIIVTILHKSKKLLEVDVPIEEHAKDGFIFVSSADVTNAAARRSMSAYSTENCSEHKNCQKTGVHIYAAVLGGCFRKYDQCVVNPHQSSIKPSRVKGFGVDSIQLGLTMYIHSTSRTVEGPVLTPVFITSERAYSFDNPLKYQDHLKHMWEEFGAELSIDSIFNSLSASNTVDFSKTWKERCVISQAFLFFNQEISKYLKSKQGNFVIVRNASLVTSINAKDVVIPADNLEMVKSAWKAPSAAPKSDEERISALGFLFSSVKRSTEEFLEEQLSDRYEWDVVSCSTLRDDQDVISTYPIAHSVDFVNQQTVLAFMISPFETPLYSKNELVLAVARRYQTPVILTAVVRKLTQTAMNLQFFAILAQKGGNRVVSLGKIFKCLDTDYDGDDIREQKILDGMVIFLVNVTCEEYCNSRLVRLSGENLSAVAAASINHGVTAVKAASHVRELIATSQEYDAPYRQHELGTYVTLTQGVELQLQVVLKDLDDDGDHWLRLLRVGKDCHLCLVHLNSPFRAFLSGRSEITALITQSSLKLMKEKIKSNSLKTVILKDVALSWDDCYFYGGTFTTPISLRRRNLLCIRKEVIGADENSTFVWNCHAVVSDVCNNLVRFLVCSLFQDQTPDIWAEIEKGRFIVEVIDVDKGNASDQ